MKKIGTIKELTNLIGFNLISQKVETFVIYDRNEKKFGQPHWTDGKRVMMFNIINYIKVLNNNY